MRRTYAKRVAKLKTLLPEAALHVVGREIGFIKRLRDLRAAPFVWALILSRFCRGVPGFAQAGSIYAQLTRRALCRRPFQMRLKCAEAVELMKRAFERMALQLTLEQARPRHPLAKWFCDIILIDSTLLHVDDSLKGCFKGLRTAVASLKATLTLSAFGARPLDLRLSSGTEHDAKLFPDLRLFEPGSLLLFDRGFVSFDMLRTITEHQLFFICALKRNTNAVILKAHQAAPAIKRAVKRGETVMLRSFLKPGAITRRVWDFDVALRTNDSYTAAAPIIVRLVIMPGPGGQQRGYLTNLPSCWCARGLRELYRLRWQIELTFKELKQDLNLTALPSRDRHAVEVFAWASLLALLLSRTIAERIIYDNSPGLSGPIRRALVTRALAQAHLVLVQAVADRDALEILASAALRAARADPHERKRQDSWARLTALVPHNRKQAA